MGDSTFHFSNIGKQMPYSVPDDFFASMQEKVLHEVANTAKPDEQSMAKPIEKRSFFTRGRTLSAIAAVGMIGVIMTFGLSIGHQSVSKSYDVEAAYDNLSDEDQAFLADIYADAEFMYEQ